MDKIELIKRNCAEIINEDKIEKFMKKGVVYCGYEVSGEIHLGHLVTIIKLLDLQKAGIKVKILLADWHTWLNKKGDWDFVNKPRHMQIVVEKIEEKLAGKENVVFPNGD